MLEAIHLTKIYKTPGGDIRALDGVNIKFAESGMVFLLGKSGSGKSTLLNVCGGLDSPTSGEIIVKGRSSKNFTQSDFDSYRNTFVGFVFQEYNMLNEFSVEENIALALKLQGKRADKKTIAGILEKVELSGYEKRKPNTLSGGEKQRVAIARALVKNPQIIMADEPTGALDSTTGKQIFETLKRLAKDKLVIVVSHDREFAERYADRIVELKDGRIISDVTKVCKGETRKDDKKPTFKETDVSDIQIKAYSSDECKFIRTHLPVGYAFKIGVSGLRLKPVRLIFTILLATFAFIMFGLLSTIMAYSATEVYASSLSSGTYFSQVFSRYTYKKVASYESSLLTDYSAAEIAEYRNTFGSSTVGLREIDININNANQYYYLFDGTFNYGIYADDAAIYLSDKLIMGTFPTETITAMEEGNVYEIAISDYIAEMFAIGLEDENGNAYSVTETSELLGKVISDNLGYRYKITGVFTTDCVPDKFDSLKDATIYNYDSALASSLSDFLKNGLYQAAVLPRAWFNAAGKDNLINMSDGYEYVFLPYDGTYEQTNILCSMIKTAFSSSLSDGDVYNNSPLSVKVQNISEYVNIFKKIFLIAGLALAVFSSLLLSSFISLSISTKRKEIGVLRAIGARGADVFKIFYSESFVVTLICVVMACAATSVLCGVLNGVISGLASMSGVNLFVLGFVPIAILVGVAIFTSIFATFFPVYSAAKKKPIDTIRAL